MRFLTLASLAAIAFSAANVIAQPMGSEFTYQGRLVFDALPVDGTCDLRFGLWDAESAGTMLDTEIDALAVTVLEGRFDTRLGWSPNHFSGDPRWIEIAVRCPAGAGSYTTLLPRQELTPTPYALLAASVAAPLNLSLESGVTAVFTNSSGTGLYAQSDSGTAAEFEGNVVVEGGLFVDDLLECTSCVNSPAIAMNAIGSDEIADGSITGADMTGGGLYSRKTQLYRAASLTSIPPNTEAVVEAECSDANDLAISHGCFRVFGSDYRIVGVDVNDWEVETAPARASCVFKNLSPTGVLDVITEIYCIAIP